MKTIKTTITQEDLEKSRVKLQIKSAQTASGCIEWTGSRCVNGYGHMHVNGKKLSTHRLSYAMNRGEIPFGLFVLHKCDNPPCLNPDHLFLGTAQDNRRDCVSKQRHSVGACNGKSVLTAEQVLKIKTMLGKFKLLEIAKMFSVGKSTIANIKYGNTWSHVGTEIELPDPSDLPINP